MRKGSNREPRNNPFGQPGKSVNKLAKYAKGNANVKAPGTTNKPNKGFGSHPKRPAKYVRKGGSFKGDNTSANNGETGPNQQSAYLRSSN